MGLVCTAEGLDEAQAGGRARERERGREERKRERREREERERDTAEGLDEAGLVFELAVLAEARRLLHSLGLLSWFRGVGGAELSLLAGADSSCCRLGALQLSDIRVELEHCACEFSQASASQKIKAQLNLYRGYN